ncbi:hypothetical protein [Bacillus cereus group sp. BfR-BA-01430]|nr:hypothetical protein [Bacillus cereus group sp. BfR-BA-01430]
MNRIYVKWLAYMKLRRPFYILTYSEAKPSLHFIVPYTWNIKTNA